MFIKKLTSGNLSIAFLKSKNVQAYPCGRRRAEVTNDTFIPFDPEARLNTEANARKHSSLNGFTQTYLKEWDETNQLLTISLAGYLFTIALGDNYCTEGNFATSLLRDGLELNDEEIADENRTSIYANILLEDIQLFSGDPKNYFTSILRNQSYSNTSFAEDTPVDSLDILEYDSNEPEAILRATYDNYYFSGLSFSTTPLTDLDIDADGIISVTRNGSSINQYPVSLCILKKVNGSWEINEQARLPKISHGSEANSVEAGTVIASTIKAPSIQATGDDGTVEATTIKATNVGTESNKITNIHATEANIDTIIADTLNVTEAITSPQLGQVIGGTTYKVPYIKLVENQLQIFNIGNISTLPSTEPEE